jgi:hypothetical protein
MVGFRTPTLWGPDTLDFYFFEGVKQIIRSVRIDNSKHMKQQIREPFHASLLMFMVQYGRGWNIASMFADTNGAQTELR